MYLAGLYRNNRLNLQNLWATDSCGIDQFRQCLRRFRCLHNTIRLDDKSTQPERLKVDISAAVREVFSLFIENCKTCYSMRPYVTVDEMLAGFRGKCRFRQYIPSKPNKYGIKIFCMVDSKIFYTGNFEVYAGKQPEDPYYFSNKPLDIVKRLAEPI